MLTTHKQFRLHPAQMAFRRSRALIRGFIGGRGAGKSHVGCYDMIRRALPDRLYMVVAPTYPMLFDSEFRTFLSIARELGVVEGDNIRRNPPAVTLATGAEVLFRSADDPERLRGPNLSGAYLAEASLMPREAFDIMIATLREGGEQGWMTACFTPKGFSHWTYDVFGKQAPNTELFHARTRDNPFGPAGFHDTLKDQYAPILALQELEGEFVDAEGAEFPGEWFGPHVWVDQFPDELALRVIYLDPSVGKETQKPLKTGPEENRKSDYSAFVKLGRDRGGMLYVWADLARRPMTQMVADGVRHAQDFRPLDGFGVESNAFQALLANEFARVSQQAGIMLPLHTINNSVNKLVRIRRLTPYLARGNVRFVEGSGTRLLVQQLREFPMGRHDDGPDAAEGALRLGIELYNGKMAKGRGR